MGKSPAVILYDETGARVGIDTNPLTIQGSKHERSPFGGMLVNPPYTIADLTHKYDISSLDYGTSTSTGGSVAHVPAESAVRLSVTNASGSTARLRTHSFYRYQAGKGLVIRISAYHTDAGQTNQVRRWGFFDDNDGLFFILNGTTLGVARRTSTSGSAVDHVVAQSSWNRDKLDGTGSSGITLDITKGNIYEVVFQWLGVGTVFYYVNGILVHETVHANSLAVPYMKTAQLPLGYDITNTGASTASSFTYVCGSVMVQGGQHPPHYTFAAYNSTDVSVGTTERPLLSIRPKATFNSITNRMTLLPILLSISNEGARAGYRVVLNGSLTGDNWQSVDSESGAEFDVAATSITGGLTFGRGFLPNTNDSIVLHLPDHFQENQRGLRQNAFATGVDVLTIMAVNEQGGTTAMRASLTWKELR